MGKEDIVWVLVLLAILWPWILLFIDGLGLFFTGIPFTGVPWSGIRVWAALVYPWIVGFIASGIPR